MNRSEPVTAGRGRTFTRRELLGAGARLGAGSLGALALPSLTDARRLATMLGAIGPQAEAMKSPPRRPTLVLGTLYGGNDGLNTVVPYGEPAYVENRKAMRIFPDEVLPIADGLGLHPALEGIKALWDAGHVAIVQGIGYPEPNLSHFASMAIWMAANLDADETTGWLGRWLDATGSDPLRSLSIGPVVPPVLVGARQQASTLVDSTTPSHQLPPGDSAFQSDFTTSQRQWQSRGELENLVGQCGLDLVQIGSVAAQALSKEAPLSVPGRDAGDFGTQLSVIGELILAGLPASVYQASMQGFDSHADELSMQRTQLSQMDAAVTALFNGLGHEPAGARTVLVLYSEFGRRVLANASGGTDHGAANVAFVIGLPVRGGLYGEMPSLTRLDENGNLVHNVDFRSLYATLLDEVLGVDHRPFLGGTWPTLRFI